MTRLNNATRVPRRKLLSDSAKVVMASTAAAMVHVEPALGRGAESGGGAQGEKGGKPHVTFSSPPTMAAAKGYTPVVEVLGGRTIYVSGQVALNRAGALVGAGDLRAQTQQVFENIKAGLEAAGATFADVIKLNFYVIDVSQVQVVRDVRDKFVNVARPPASTLVEVRRLVRDDFMIEVDAIASVVG